MKSTSEKFPQLSTVDNAKKPDQEIFSSVLKQWRKRFAYASIFATVPALVVSQLQVAQTVEAKQPESHYPGRGRPLDKLNSSPSKRALLKRQSQFLLPHQKGNFAMLASLAGTDDCPGVAIPGGTYSAAAPYIQVGDTTGANDTISGVPSYYYYASYSAHGPDHIYSFTLTSLGPNPRIEVSTSSGSYKPVVYLLQGGVTGACPGGTGNFGNRPWAFADSRWNPGDNKATIYIDYLPLNVPFYLLVDSAENDSSGAGPYTIQMQDVTIAPVPDSNPIDNSEFFVRQHYLDFLNRQPDQDGLAFWTKEITSCGGDQACIEARRINDSGSFFLSIEFQETGYLVYRLYKAAYGDIPGSAVPLKLNEFTPDTQAIGSNVIVKQAGWEQVLENNKRAFVADFVQRSRFTTAFVPSMSASEFVDKLNLNAGNPLSSTERDQLASDLLSGNRSRADVLRAIAEHPNLAKAEFNRAFVLMQYFGYLRRNPDDAPDGNFIGYNFWLDKLNKFNGDFTDAEMVKAFLASAEYRQRFGH